MYKDHNLVVKESYTGKKSRNFYKMLMKAYQILVVAFLV